LLAHRIVGEVRIIRGPSWSNLREEMDEMVGKGGNKGTELGPSGFFPRAAGRAEAALAKRKLMTLRVRL